jgi:hypothetical protein
MFERLRFNWKAQTAHGLHSPFVYDLYVSVINPIYQQSNVNLVEKLIHGVGSHLKLAKGKMHVIDLSRIQEIELEAIESLFESTDNVIICLNPHANAQTYLKWQRFYQNKLVIHSIELFEMGIISLNQTAPKQHFWLKKS